MGSEGQGQLLFPFKGREGRLAKNGTVSVLHSGVNLEELGNTCLSQLLWEVLFGSGNLKQQPTAASETQAVF